MSEKNKTLTTEERKALSHQRIFWLLVCINLLLFAYFIYEIIAIAAV